MQFTHNITNFQSQFARRQTMADSADNAYKSQSEEYDPRSTISKHADKLLLLRPFLVKSPINWIPAGEYNYIYFLWNWTDFHATYLWLCCVGWKSGKSVSENLLWPDMKIPLTLNTCKSLFIVLSWHYKSDYVYHEYTYQD